MALQRKLSGNTRPKLEPKLEPRLELVLKCDSAGSVESVGAAISKITFPEVELSVIHSGIGAVNKSDVMLAETGSRLITGFQVDVLPGMDKVVKEHNVEVRLYKVIYTLTGDIQTIAESLVPTEYQEQIIGSARVIATFKSSRKGIILGCDVLDGFLALGQHFRIISAMGPVYMGIIESVHIGENSVQKITRGQQAGIKIRDYKQARIGDLVESFRPLPKKVQPWQPTGKIIRT
jgi:translation initiation factor IF-2